MAIADEHQIPRELASRLVAAESSWNPQAVSPAGAQGLTQMLPGTQRDQGVTNPFDPVQSLRGGFGYLKQQYDRFGDWPSAIAAYHAGPANFAKGKIGPATHEYVGKVMQGGSPSNLSPSSSVSASASAPALPSAGEPPANARPFQSLIGGLTNQPTAEPNPGTLLGRIRTPSGGEMAPQSGQPAQPGTLIGTLFGEDPGAGAKPNTEANSPQMPKKPSGYGQMDYSGFLNSGYTEGRGAGTPGDGMGELGRMIGLLNNMAGVGGQRSRKRVI
jgi:hypothetical protein